MTRIKNKSKLVEKQEDEEYKRYLRCTCTPEEALKMVAQDMSKLKSQERDIIRTGKAIRKDALYLTEQKSQKKNPFLKAVEYGLEEHTDLGPNIKNQVEEVMTKYQDNVVFDDRISFFKMEYILYALRELQRLDEDASFLQEDIADLLK